jgi:hypothetical protein
VLFRTHSVSTTPLASLSIPTLLLARHEDASSPLALAEVKHLHDDVIVKMQTAVERTWHTQYSQGQIL